MGTIEFVVLGYDQTPFYRENRYHIWISISSPDSDPPNIPKSNSLKDILYLRFNDWNNEQKQYIEEHYPNSPTAKDMVYCCKKDAKDIISFVRRHLEEIEVIVCQCEAGISRSAGVAAALSKCIIGKDEYFFDRYLPNSLVYHTIVNQWHEEDNKG